MLQPGWRLGWAMGGTTRLQFWSICSDSQLVSGAEADLHSPEQLVSLRGHLLPHEPLQRLWSFSEAQLLIPLTSEAR